MSHHIQTGLPREDNNATDNNSQDDNGPDNVAGVYARQAADLAAIVEGLNRDEHNRHTKTLRTLQTLAASLNEQHSELQELANRLTNDTPTMRTVYRERARLVAFLAALYPAVRSANDPRDHRTVVYIEAPTGQLSWHIDPADEDLFDHVPAVGEDDPSAEWDHHTTATKHDRLTTLTVLAAAPIRLSSFGYERLTCDEPPVTGDRFVDLRELVPDMTVDADLRDADGRDPRVRQLVMTTPGLVDLVWELVTFVESSPNDRAWRVAVGDVDGRHWAPAVVEAIAGHLSTTAVPFEIVHHHIDAQARGES